MPRGVPAEVWDTAGQDLAFPSTPAFFSPSLFLFPYIFSVREEQCRAIKGGQTTQKANIYLGDVMDISVTAVLNALPYDISLRSELRSQHLS